MSSLSVHRSSQTQRATDQRHVPPSVWTMGSRPAGTDDACSTIVRLQIGRGPPWFAEAGLEGTDSGAHQRREFATHFQWKGSLSITTDLGAHAANASLTCALPFTTSRTSHSPRTVTATLTARRFGQHTTLKGSAGTSHTTQNHEQKWFEPQWLQPTWPEPE